MKKLSMFLVVLAGVLFFSCTEKEEDVIVLTPYELLTRQVWVSDSLLADGVDAGGEGEMLEKFNGPAEFRTDGTGTFGDYAGTWSLSEDNTQLTIITPDLPVQIIALVAELSMVSLKITTAFPDFANPGETIAIRMTFVPQP